MEAYSDHSGSLGSYLQSFRSLPQPSARRRQKYDRHSAPGDDQLDSNSVLESVI